jgi:hypothetical protein
MTEQHKATPEQWEYTTAGASHRDNYQGNRQVHHEKAVSHK